MRKSGPSFSVDAAVPLVAALVITIGGVIHHGSAEWLQVGLGLGAGLSLFLRRRAPALTLAVSGGLALYLLHFEPKAGATAVIAPGVALYSLALHRGFRARIIAAITAVVAIVIVDTLHSGGPTLLQTLGHALLVAIPMLVADVHRVRHANVTLLRDRLLLAERTREQEAQRRAQEERLRIARDLHDVVAHTLTSINVQASTAGQLAEQDPGHARQALRTIEEASRDAIDELRAVLGVLRSGDEGDPPLRPAPDLGDVADLVQRTRDEGVEVDIEVTGLEPSRVPEAVSLAAYRIVQESLTNARRHAAGAVVRIKLSFAADGLGMTIENEAGRPAPAIGNGMGVGIMGMTERATAIGGTLTATPLGRGFRVDAQLPFARA